MAAAGVMVENTKAGIARGGSDDGAGEKIVEEDEDETEELVLDTVLSLNPSFEGDDKNSSSTALLLLPVLLLSLSSPPRSRLRLRLRLCSRPPALRLLLRLRLWRMKRRRLACCVASLKDATVGRVRRARGDAKAPELKATGASANDGVVPMSICCRAFRPGVMEGRG